MGLKMAALQANVLLEELTLFVISNVYTIVKESYFILNAAGDFSYCSR